MASVGQGPKKLSLTPFERELAKTFASTLRAMSADIARAVGRRFGFSIQIADVELDPAQVRWVLATAEQDMRTLGMGAARAARVAVIAAAMKQAPLVSLTPGEPPTGPDAARRLAQAQAYAQSAFRWCFIFRELDLRKHTLPAPVRDRLVAAVDAIADDLPALIALLRLLEEAHGRTLGNLVRWLLDGVPPLEAIPPALSMPRKAAARPMAAPAHP